MFDPNGTDDQGTSGDVSLDDLKHAEAKPPSVTGEEDVFSGDTTTSESPDIDEELKKVGLPHDNDDGPPPALGTELDEEE